MSYGLMVYSVDLDKVIAACGSGDDKLRRMICGRFRNDLSRRQDWFSSEIEGGAPSPFDAIRALIMGDPPMVGHGFMYGYAYKDLVGHFGQSQYNNPFSPCNHAWIEAIGATLTTLGASTLSMSNLQYGGSPVKFPNPDDFPAFGYWSRDDVLAGNDLLNGPEFQSDLVPPDHAEAIDAIRGWLTFAAGRRDAIVAFYH